MLATTACGVLVSGGKPRECCSVTATSRRPAMVVRAALTLRLRASFACRPQPDGCDTRVSHSLLRMCAAANTSAA